MNSEFGPNGRGVLGWLLDNIPAVISALSAASGILSVHKRRTIWVWLFAVSAFLFTFFTEVSRNLETSENSENSENSGSYGETDTTETKGLR
jgi:hypothetical protein